MGTVMYSFPALSRRFTPIRPLQPITSVCTVALAVAFLASWGCGRINYDSATTEGDGGSSGDSDGGSQGTSDGGMSGVTDGGSPGACVDETCDVFPQCGCDEGLKCDVDGLGGRLCTSAGTILHAQSCQSSDECLSSTTCTRMSDWQAGIQTCFQFCNSNADCAPLGQGSLCALSASSNGQRLFSLCTLPCDIVNQTGCQTGTQCSLYNFGATAGSNCTAPGTVAEGDTCAVHFDCQASMMCVSSTCRQICVVGDDTPCQGNETCNGTGLMSGNIEYGACL